MNEETERESELDRELGVTAPKEEERDAASVFEALCSAAIRARTDDEGGKYGFVLTAAALADEAWELAGAGVANDQ